MGNELSTTTEERNSKQNRDDVVDTEHRHKSNNNGNGNNNGKEEEEEDLKSTATHTTAATVPLASSYAGDQDHQSVGMLPTKSSIKKEKRRKSFNSLPRSFRSGSKSTTTVAT